jgi:hypothetical protein
LKVGIENNVEQPALAAAHRRHSGNWCIEPAVRANDAQTPGSLADEHPPVGQENRTRWVLKPGHRIDHA